MSILCEKKHAISTVCSFKQEHKRQRGETTWTYVGLKNENLKCEGAPLLIGFNNSQVKTLKAVIDHNINLDQKMKERSPSCKSIALFELNYIWHMKRYHVSTGYQLLLAMAPRKNSVWSVTFQCSASQRCSYMFVFALIGVEIEFIQPNDSLEKAETSEHQIDEAFSSLQSHRRPHIGGLPYP